MPRLLHDDNAGCPEVHMPTVETPAPHHQTSAEVAADRLIETILRTEGPSHQHLAPSHLKCLGTTCLRAPSGVQFLGMTHFWATILECPSGFVCSPFWARP
jgi:hypothetical protein